MSLQIVAHTQRQTLLSNSNVFILIGYYLSLTNLGSAEEGGLKFGYNGKVYSFSTATCPGGVFFKKPLKLDFLCPNGYFLKRSNGCSNKAEEIISAENFKCFRIKKHELRVQSLISMTNPDYPTAHTVTLYDDEVFLKGFRRYTVESAVRKSYIPNENETSVIIVINPRHTQPMKIGGLCYKGVANGEGSAFKVKIKGYKNKVFDSKNFFKKGCGKFTTPVVLEDGQRFRILVDRDALHVNTTEFSKLALEARMAKPARNIDLDADDESSYVALMRAKKNDESNEQVFLDLRNNEDDDVGQKMLGEKLDDSSNLATQQTNDDENVTENVEARTDDGHEDYAKEDDDLATTDNNTGPKGFIAIQKFDDVETATKIDEDNEIENLDSSNSDKFTTETFIETTEEAPVAEIYFPIGSNPDSISKHISNEESTSKIDDGHKTPHKTKKKSEISNNKKVLRKPNKGSNHSTRHKGPSNARKRTRNTEEIVPLQVTDLKDEVVLNYAKADLSNYVVELVHIARQTVYEGIGEVDKKGVEIVPQSGGANGSLVSYSTEWYKMLKGSVEVVAKILPTASIPPQMFRDALNLVALLGKNVDREISHSESEKILTGLKDCASYPKMKIEYAYDKDVCPPRLKNLTVWGVEWDESTSAYKENVPFEIVDISSMDQSIFGGKGYQSTSHMYFELIFMAFDLAYTVCHQNFKTMMNSHAKFGKHVSSIFLQDDLYKRWTETERISDNVYLTLLTSWNGRRFPDITLELDALRYAIKSRSVPSANIDIRKLFKKMQRMGNTVSAQGHKSGACLCGMDNILRKCRKCEPVSKGYQRIKRSINDVDDRSALLQNREIWRTA